MLEEYIKQIKDVTKRAKTEAKLQVKLDNILQSLLSTFSINYDPAVNETLKSLGLSQVDSDRPDSLFGHVVLDYKAPYLLESQKELLESKQQIERYLNSVTNSHDANPEECAKWAGILWDGAHLAFCHSSGKKWLWSERFSVSEASLLTLVQIYRSLKRKPLTASLLSSTFGKESAIAQNLLPLMCNHLSKPRHKTSMLFREWKRLFQQVSTYGLDQLPSLKEWARRNGVVTTDASQILFAIHTYYALVVKLLTSELLAAVQPISIPSLCEAIANARDSETLYQQLSCLEDGDYWRNFRISNFLEGDFFSWYTNEKSKDLARSIQSLAREFLDFEPATAVIRPEAIKDLVKEFYTSLVDEQIRHDLGEYYTPDWLAQFLLDKVNYNGDLEIKVLDPACGSGTFLVECINRLRQKCEDKGLSKLETLRTITDLVRGLDLNPLAVISSRANYILSIADLVFTLGDDVEIPVYLADCINVPIEKTGDDGVEVLEFSLDTEIGCFSLEVPLSLVKAQVLGKILLTCEDAIKEGRSEDSFITRLKKEFRSHITGPVDRRIRAFFNIIKHLEEKDWNRIWCRIVKNNFSPKGIGQIDLVIGNPPWVRWSRLPETYRNRVKWFCEHYGLVSGRGYSGGIESDISTVITFSSADHWLKIGGYLAFLITWTVFKSASARGFRLATLPDGSALKVERIEDLTAIQPFPDAANETSIYIAQKVSNNSEAEFDKVSCGIWFPKGSARIDPKTSLDDILEGNDIIEGVACPVGNWGSPLFTGSEEDFKESSVLRGNSKYLQTAHRGTISDLARVFWVKVEDYSSGTNRALIRTLRMDELPAARAVDPVHGIWIEAEILFPLMRGRDLGRYCFKTDAWYQIIPNRHYEKVDGEEEFADKYPCAYSYLYKYKDLLCNRSSFKRYQSHLPFYVIYCVGDYTFSKWKVVWMEQQDPRSFRCCVISENANSLIPNKILVPDHKLYLAQMTTQEEAHYLCAYLNSHPVRTWVGGFLHGKQIATSIFEFMKVPVYDPNDRNHQSLVEISKEAHRTRENTSNKHLLNSSLENELKEIVYKIGAG